MPKINEVAATLHSHLCVCPKHGYTQGPNRWGNNKLCKVTAYNRDYYLNGGDRDCSSSVSNAWQKALEGTKYEGTLDGATWTGDMRQVFEGSGLFDWHPMGDGYIAQRGDVYLRHNWANGTGHTAMCQSPDPDTLSEFICNEWGGSTGGQEGDQTGNESRPRPYYDFPWDGILAYNHKADTPDLPDSLKRYTDLDPSAWYIPYIQKVVEDGIMAGMGSRFEPNGGFTRGQCLVTLSRKEAWECVKGKRKLPFNDIGAYYTEPIIEGVERGVVDSSSPSFKPNDFATRETFATYIWRAMGSPEAEPYGHASPWAQVAVGWCMDVGIFKGDPNPRGELTRAEAAAMLCRF